MSLSQRAYDEIKHRIVTLVLQPGSVISENSLQNELGVGRTPIREALQQLERDKLVEIIPRRGIFVSDVELIDLQRLHEVRVPLERLAIQLAVRRGQEQHWREMDALLQEAQYECDNNHLLAIDEKCHRLIYQAADNKFLEDTLNVNFSQSLRWWYYALPRIKEMPTKVLEHRQMLDAMIAGDAARAADILEQHICDFHHEIEQAMLQKMTT